MFLLFEPKFSQSQRTEERPATWVDKYGTGSGSDRLKPATHKPFPAHDAGGKTGNVGRQIRNRER
jgi:hypothetical protein